MIIGCFSACKAPIPDPNLPMLEISAEKCTAEFEGNNYTMSVTHVMQGVTTVTFDEPEAVEGVVYNFSGNGCEITFGDLSLKTDKSFMNDYALPQMIHDVFESAKSENVLVYTDSEKSSDDTPTAAVFNGKCDGFSYEIAADYDTGSIKEIRIPECDCKIKFS